MRKCGSDCWKTFFRKNVLNNCRNWSGALLQWSVLFRACNFTKMSPMLHRWFLLLIWRNFWNTSEWRFLQFSHCVKGVRIRSFSGPHFPAFGLNTNEILSLIPYSVRMRENTDLKNSRYGHFSCSLSDYFCFNFIVIPVAFNCIYLTLWRFEMRSINETLKENKSKHRNPCI